MSILLFLFIPQPVFAPLLLNNQMFFPLVLEQASKRQLTHKSKAKRATLVTGVSLTPVSQTLFRPAPACRQMGCPPGCLGRITSVEENRAAWTNFYHQAAEVTTVTPGSDPKTPRKPARPASSTLTVESTRTAVKISVRRKPLSISSAPNP